LSFSSMCNSSGPRCSGTSLSVALCTPSLMAHRICVATASGQRGSWTGTATLRVTVLLISGLRSSRPPPARASMALVGASRVAGVAGFSRSGARLATVAARIASVAVASGGSTVGVPVSSCVATATAVAFAGIIGFVGLISPHVARRLWGADYRWVLPGSLVVGALFLVGARDLAGVLVPDVVLPVGLFTAFAGAPFFFLLLLRHRRTAYMGGGG